MPAKITPQLATPAREAPRGPGWIAEIKLDGYRLLIWLDHGATRLVTRSGQDWTERMPRLAARFKALKIETAVLDGELVALRPDGSSNFHDLQAALSAKADGVLFYYAFDLIHLNGWDLRHCTLRDRKRLLAGLEGWDQTIRYADHVDDNGAGLLREAARLDLEGIVAKRADGRYRAGRSTAWLKIKCLRRQSLVVLGWTPPGGSRRGIGALVLGFYDSVQRLHHAGQVGSGFTDDELKSLATRLAAMPSEPPDALIIAGDDPGRAIRWIAPDLVAEIEFAGWSGEGRVRHPVYLGLRDDQTARDVVIEIPDPEAKRRVFRGKGRVA